LTTHAASPPGEPKESPGFLRELALGALAVTIAVLPLLISPRVPRGEEKSKCVTVTDLWGPVHVTTNCDSGSFLGLAKRPTRILEKEHRFWQSRPMYAVLGWITSLPFRALPLSSIENRLRRPGGQVPEEYRYLPEYAGLVFLNWLLIVAAVVVFVRLLDARTPFEPRVLLPIVVLVLNESTKAYFWTPHTQMFNILMPVVGLWLYHSLQPRLPTLEWRAASLIGLALGLAGLAYGAFVVVAVGAVLCILFAEGLPILRQRLAGKLFASVALLIGFAIPVVAWMTIATIKTGSFHSEEVRTWREFVWMGDSLSLGAGVFLADLKRNLGTYVHTIPPVVAFPALTICAIVLLEFFFPTGDQPAKRSRQAGIAIACYVGASVPFYALMGFYTTRLSATIVPPLLWLLGLELGRLERALDATKRRVLRLGTVAVALCYALFWVFSAGPYS
jgi:hypothetical protein